MSAGTPSDRIEVTANERSNSLIVYSSADNFRAIQNLVQSLDNEDAEERQTRSFELKNADAEDVAKQLKDLSQDQSGSNTRYPYVIFSSMSAPRDGKKTSVVADRR